MWVYEHGLETSATPQAIWRLWTDVQNWGTWNADIEKVEISGPFAIGVEITMTPLGQDPVRLRITDLTQYERFIDEASIDKLLLRTIHRLARLDQHRTQVTYRMEITGPGADEIGPQIGPAITADWPETMASLVRLAQE
ncbi:MAG: polyketide cyclase [Acidimicrobiales bacterium]|nr:MAG: polyketide cyclase [Acidimicrobiales bacterium]